MRSSISSSSDEESLSQIADQPHPYLVHFVNGSVFVGNVLTCLLYIVSANGFLKHLSEAPNGLPASVYYPHNMTDFEAPAWNVPVLAAFVSFSVFLFSSNHRSMMPRVYRMLGWEHGPELIPWGSQTYAKVESLVSAFWKGSVACTSFLALLASDIRLDFKIALALTGIVALGNISASGAIFLGPNSSVFCYLPKWLRKGLVTYLAGSYSASQMALYFNTIHQGPGRAHLDFLLSLPKPWKIGLTVAHGVWNVLFGVTTYIHNYPRIKRLFPKYRVLEESDEELQGLNDGDVILSDFTA